MQQILDVLNIVYVTLTGNIFHFTSKKKLYSLQLFPQNLLLCLLMKKQKGKANISPLHKSSAKRIKKTLIVFEWVQISVTLKNP